MCTPCLVLIQTDELRIKILYELIREINYLLGYCNITFSDVMILWLYFFKFLPLKLIVNKYS